MMGRQYFFVIAAVFFASCNGHLETYEIERNINFTLNMDQNLGMLKEMNAYKDFGSELIDIYSFMETRADQIYRQVEESVNKGVHMYNEFYKIFISLKEKIARSVIDDKQSSLQRNPTFERIKKYEEIIEKNSVEEKNKPMLKKLLQQNYVFANQMNNIMTKNQNQINKLDATINGVKKNVPSEDRMRNIIDSKIESFETVMKAAQTVFMKNTKQIIENIKKTKDLGIDDETVQRAGSLKLYGFKETINYRCDEFTRKIRKIERSMVGQYNRGVGFVDKLKEIEKNVFIEYSINTAVTGALLEKNFKIIDDHLNMAITTTAASVIDEIKHGSISADTDS